MPLQPVNPPSQAGLRGGPGRGFARGRSHGRTVERLRGLARSGRRADRFARQYDERSIGRAGVIFTFSIETFDVTLRQARRHEFLRDATARAAQELIASKAGKVFTEMENAIGGKGAKANMVRKAQEAAEKALGGI